MIDHSADIGPISGADLLGAAGLDAAKCVVEGQRVLDIVTGPGRRLVSLTLDLVSDPKSDDRVEFSPVLDKRTRTLSFVRLQARSAASLVFSLTAIYATKGEAGDERTGKPSMTGVVART